MDEEIRYPPGFSLGDILAWGSFGLVCLDQSSSTVVKSPHDAESEPFIDAEKHIYERLTEMGGHAGILKYFGTYDGSSIRLEYAPNGDLRTYLNQDVPSISPAQRERWLLQVAQSLEFIHRAGVIHGDLQSKNVFLSEGYHAKIADFSGSSLDGSPLLVHVAANYAHPTQSGSVTGDIFSLGCLMYEVVTGEPPYATLDEREMHEQYSNKDFPSTNSLGSVGDIIKGCWFGTLLGVHAIVQELQGLFVVG